MPTSSAATEIMYRGRPPSRPPRSLMSASVPRRSSRSSEQPLPRIYMRRLLEGLERLALGLGQLLGDVHSQPREQVAAAGAVQLRRAAPLDPEQLPVLRARRHLQRDAALGSGDLDRRTHGGFAEGDWHVENEVVAA